MFRRLHGVELRSHAWATSYAGVCGRDDATLWYASRDERDQNSDTTPLHPYRVSIASSFHLAGAITAVPDRREEGAEDASARCGRLAADPTARWTGAATADDVVGGALALALAAQQVRDGRPKSCERATGETARCEDVLLAASATDDLDQVDRCPAEDGRGCFDLLLSGDTEIELRVRLDPQTEMPAAIESAKVSSYIVVT